ncbi:hypothetical protein [Aestuariirhabdus sp. LZHN29]|uniref:hypothetical protein n=1 Tax=Aestuariirhabdus sp. LZHN29 TaxID=3417462 RepID=UPI003CF6C541
MLLDYLDTEYVFMSLSLVAATCLLAMCCHEYQIMRQSERELEEDLKNPPKPIYQHDLKAFKQKREGTKK